MAKRKNKPGAGRPEMVIDATQVAKLAMLQCSYRQIGAFFDCDHVTIMNRFTDIVERGREQGRSQLIRKQYEIAMEGNVTMLIWLGKNYLGQTDKSDITTGGDKIQVLPPIIK